MIQLSWILVAPILIYLAFSWFRVLKEDQAIDEIIVFSLSFLFLTGLAFYLGLLLGLALPLVIIVGWFWVMIFARLRNWNPWLMLESMVFSLLICLLLENLVWLLLGRSFGIWFVLRAGVPVLIWLANLYLGRYRQFHWYTSGKVGFLFLADLMLLSVLSSGLDFYFSNRIEWANVLWLGLTLTSLVSVVSLSGRLKLFRRNKLVY
ncbi:MAG: hypothetical protein ABID04_02815 [Patescibacteria group bacterium]